MVGPGLWRSHVFESLMIGWVCDTHPNTVAKVRIICVMESWRTYFSSRSYISFLEKKKEKNHVF